MKVKKCFNTEGVLLIYYQVGKEEGGRKGDERRDTRTEREREEV